MDEYIEIWDCDTEIIVNLSDGRTIRGTRHFHGPNRAKGALKCVRRLCGEGYSVHRQEAYCNLIAMIEEEIRERTWNLCKEFDAARKRRAKVLLTNFISTKLEWLFGSETENLFRQEWLEEVDLFSRKYGYAD